MKATVNASVETREVVPITDMLNNVQLSFEYVCNLTDGVLSCLIL